MSIEQALRAHILENFMYSGAGDDLSDDLALFEGGIIDSTGVLELVAFIEQSFSITVDDADLLPENFATISAMARFIRARRA
jgi:acyl carrier protein